MFKKSDHGFTRTLKFGVSLHSKRGFTLIELLVVIAIIGVLASIVLASLKSASDKAANSSIRANLSNARAQAEIHYDLNGSYNPNICLQATATGIWKFLDAADTANGGGSTSCERNPVGAQTYAAQAQLKTPENGSNYWCIDSTGVSKGTVLVYSSGTYVCPN